MEQLQSMWWKMMRWLCFFSSRPASVILAHYIIAVDLTTAAELRFSAVPEACSWPVRGVKKCLWHVPVLIKAAWHPLIDPKPPVFLPEGENPAISCGAASWLRQAKHVCITLHYRSSLLLSPVLPAHTKEMQTYQERLNPGSSSIVCLHNNFHFWWLLDKDNHRWHILKMRSNTLCRF